MSRLHIVCECLSTVREVTGYCPSTEYEGQVCRANIGINYRQSYVVSTEKGQNEFYSAKLVIGIVCMICLLLMYDLVQLAWHKQGCVLCCT